MLFNSYIFIYLFFPLTVLGFFLIAKLGREFAILWLALTSLAFYANWNFVFVFLLLGSIAFNYCTGASLSRIREINQRAATALMFFGIACNLAALGYFKYGNFVRELCCTATMRAPQGVAEIALPLGISFFTFTQIAFLVDARRGIAKEFNARHYLLFVTYFPHLIAGPVLHHRQLMPQFSLAEVFRPTSENFVVGALIFAIGLAKKVLLADGFAEYANPVFDDAGRGITAGFQVAWFAAVAYSLQIYFDFSGYSDMAIGLSRILGIRLPINFDSPYRASSIIEFWRRWHITLSNFLKDYLYIPLGGNRLGEARRYANLLTTMVLGGLWHGAGWTFLLWGGFHGLLLSMNYLWRHVGFSAVVSNSMIGKAAGVVITFTLVTIGWVLFRADGIDSAWRLLVSMLNWPAAAGSISGNAVDSYYSGRTDAAQSFGIASQLAMGMVIVWFMPNSIRIAGLMRPGLLLGRYFVLGMLIFVIALLATINASRGSSEFIYFNF